MGFEKVSFKSLGAFSLLSLLSIILSLFTPSSISYGHQNTPTIPSVQVQIVAGPDFLTLVIDSGQNVPIDFSQLAFGYSGVYRIFFSQMFNSIGVNATQINVNSCYTIFKNNVDPKLIPTVCQGRPGADSPNITPWWWQSGATIGQNITVYNNGGLITFTFGQNTPTDCQVGNPSKPCIFFLPYPATATPTFTITPSATFTPTPTPSPEPTSTPLPTFTPTSSATITASLQPPPVVEPSPTVPSVPTVTPTPSAQAFTATPTASPTFTPAKYEVVCRTLQFAGLSSDVKYAKRITWNTDGNQIAFLDTYGKVYIGKFNVGFDQIQFESLPLTEIFTGISATSLAWQPNGDLLLVSFSNGQVLIWDTNKKSSQGYVEGNPIFTSDVTWSPDGLRFATGGGDSAGIKVWRNQNGNWTLDGKPLKNSRVDSLAWSFDGTKITMNSNSALISWTLDSEARTEKQHQDDTTLTGIAFNTNPDVTSISWLPFRGKSQLVSTHVDGSVKLWTNLESPPITIARHLKTPINANYTYAQESDRKYFVIGTSVGVRIYDSASGIMIETILNNSKITALSVRAEYILASTENGAFVLCNMPLLLKSRLSRASMSFKSQQNSAPITALAWSKNGNFLAVGMKNGYITVWQYDLSIQRLTELTTFIASSTTVSALAWDPNPSKGFLAVGDCNNDVGIWVVNTTAGPSTPEMPVKETSISLPKPATGCVPSVTFDPSSSNRIAITNRSKNPSIDIYDTSGKKLFSVSTTTLPNAIVWNDNSFIAVASDSARLGLVNTDAKSKEILGPVQYPIKQGGQNKFPNFIDIEWKGKDADCKGSKGSKIVIATDSELLDVWCYADTDPSVLKREPIKIVDGVQDITVDPEGKIVMGTTDNLKVRLWNLDYNELLADISLPRNIVELSWRPVGIVVATAEDNGDIILWVVSP